MTPSTPKTAILQVILVVFLVTHLRVLPLVEATEHLSFGKRDLFPPNNFQQRKNKKVYLPFFFSSNPGYSTTSPKVELVSQSCLTPRVPRQMKFPNKLPPGFLPKRLQMEPADVSN